MLYCIFVLLVIRIKICVVSGCECAVSRRVLRATRVAMTILASTGRGALGYCGGVGSGGSLYIVSLASMASYPPPHPAFLLVNHRTLAVRLLFPSLPRPPAIFLDI